ncbi:MAG TPA: helix-turn-helix transcriptional regulator [Solirubrobacterales bacterium]|nr:helix-turn-helix transcriptional regulator [Solirubrobacterales bacterium]
MSLSEKPFDLGECEVALGRAIRLAREHKRMTEAELADRLGWHADAVARIEDGEGGLTLETVADLTVKGLNVRFGEVGHLVDQYLGRT